MATETFKLNFAINCLWIRNVAIFFLQLRIFCAKFTLKWVWSLFIYTLVKDVLLAFSFNVFLGLKDFLSDVTAGTSHENLSWLSCGSLANSMWYGNFLWLKRGSTFMAAQRVSTAASVSSFSSSQECLISSGYHAAHAVLTGLAFCSMIVIFKAQISLFLVSSSSCKGFNCLCISLEIWSANSCRLGWIICFSWPLISGDLRAAPRHIKWNDQGPFCLSHSLSYNQLLNQIWQWPCSDTLLPISFRDRLVPLFTNGPALGALSDRAAVKRDQASAQCRGPLWGLETCMIDHQFDTRKCIRISNQMTKLAILTYPVTDMCKICGTELTWSNTLLSAWSHDNCRSSLASLLPVPAP